MTEEQKVFPAHPFLASTYAILSSVHTNISYICAVIRVVSKHVGSPCPCSASGIHVTPEAALFLVAQRSCSPPLLQQMTLGPFEEGSYDNVASLQRSWNPEAAGHGTARLPGPCLNLCAEVLTRRVA